MIVGSATFTTVASTMMIETPRLRTASPIQRPRPSVMRPSPSRSIVEDSRTRAAAQGRGGLRSRPRSGAPTLPDRRCASPCTPALQGGRLMIRSLLLGAAVAALVALGAVPAAGAAPGARAAAATCPGTFTVLHNDHIGSVAFPAGQYRVATNQLSCATASQLFSRFLEDYDGVLPAPWQLIGNIRRFQKVGTASEFQVTPLAPPKPSSLTCPGTFTRAAQRPHRRDVGPGRPLADHAAVDEGPLLRPGRVAARDVPGLRLVRRACRAPWTMNVATRTFQTSPTNGFRITYKGVEQRWRRSSPGHPPGPLPDVPRAEQRPHRRRSSCRRARTTCGPGAASPAGRRPRTSARS